jgi:uncharacterized damage-inducible protein DinB
MDGDVARALVQESRRRLLDESIPRLRRCLELLTEEQVWWRPNEASNAVGNLVLHVCGNARQWIAHGLGGEPDQRQRQAEFDARGELSKADLIAQLNTTSRAVETALVRLDPGSLLQRRRIQAFSETGLAMLVHVVEHFSYHVGQVALLTKLLTASELGFYSKQDVDRGQ